MTKSKKQNNIFNNKRCYIFDFDGVIKDSINVKTKAFLKIYEKEGQEIAQQVKKYHLNNGGVTRIKKFQYYEKILLKKKINKKKINELCKIFSLIVKKEVINSKPIPGVIRFLKKLKLDNKLIAINSATPTKELKEIIYGCSYKKYFDKIYGSRLSKSDNLLTIINDFNISSEQIIFFGDAKNDFLAAKELNIAFVGVGNYFRDKNIKQNNKYFFINDFNDLM